MSASSIPTAILAGAVFALLTVPRPSVADDAVPDRGAVAAGLELDLLPALLSAADGRLGGGANLWVGRDRVRLRAVGTYLAFPGGVLTPEGFQGRRLTVAAGIVDLFLRPGFTGPWLGAGLECWWNRVGSAAGPATASWTSGVATVGGGYVWKVWRGVYLNPWAAGHVLLSSPQVQLYGATWRPQALTGEFSVKLGVEFQ